MILKTEYPLLEVEIETLRGFDPFAHYTRCELVNTGNLDHISLSEGDSGTSGKFRAEFEKSIADLANQKAIVTRAHRYFAAETLILLILSAPPFGPFLRTSTEVRSDSLNNAIMSISEKSIPVGFSLKQAGGAILEFRKWLGFMLYKDFDFFIDPENEDVADLISDEAKLLGERGFVNAFKHCRPIAVAPSFGGEIQKDGKRIAEVPSFPGLQWHEWIHDKKQKKVSIKTTTEEIDTNFDRERILDVSILMQGIREFRIASLLDQGATSVQTPVVRSLQRKLKTSRIVNTLNYED